MEISSVLEMTAFQLKAARYTLDFSLKDVYNATGVAPATIRRIESKELNSPPKRTSILVLTKLKVFYEHYGAIFNKDGSLALKDLRNMIQENGINIFEDE